MKIRNSIILLVLFALLISSQLFAGVVEIKKLQRQETAHQQINHLKHQVSNRNLLGLEYTGKYNLPSAALSDNEPKVIRILAIKVNFIKEEVDDKLTTGNGNIDLRTQEQFELQEGNLVDPAPHNNDYFLKHLEALATYYRIVSNGRLILEYDIYPQKTDSAYQLDENMAFYGLQQPAFGLGQFFFDSWTKADQDSGLHFFDDDLNQPRFDAYLVFHAGADQQNNLGGVFGPNTTGDLFTGYITLAAPISIDDGLVQISDGMIMPETVSQDNRIVALNAVIAHEFCHQLGGIDLYDTRTFVTGVGDFALMDNNGLSINVDLGGFILVSGVMPIFPCAWTRAYLGFVDVVEVTDFNNIKVAAAELDTTENQILLVPINADEYFLIENRQVDIDGDGQTALKADLDNTMVFLGPRSPDENKPEINREYDFLMPGSGMLIWHVDERVAGLDYDGDGLNNFDDNDLQWFSFPQLDDPLFDNHRQFLALEEADGIIDFGREYISGFGKQIDIFEINNNDNFGPYTNPPTSANNNGYTGITIDDISSSRLVMTCDINITGKYPGWSNFVGANPQPLLSYDLDGNGIQDIITAVDNYILAYNLNGTALINNAQIPTIIVERDVYYGNGKVVDTLAVFAALPAGNVISQPLAIADIYDDNTGEILAVTTNNKLYCYSTESASNLPEKIFEFDLGVEAISAPMIFDYDPQIPGLEIGILLASDDFLILSNVGIELVRLLQNEQSVKTITNIDGTFLSTVNNESNKIVKGAAAADFDRDGTIETAVVCFDGTLQINYSASPVVINTGYGIFSDISLGDIDDDGYVDILFCGDNMIFAYNYNGILKDNFPIEVNRFIPIGAVTSNPALADLDGDGKMEIFVGTANGELAGFDYLGRRLNNYPKAAGGTITSTPIITTNAIFTISKEGEINAFAINGNGGIDWNSQYGTSANRSSYELSLPAPKSLTEAIGSFYNYPNPVSDETTLRFTIRQEGKIKLKLYNLAGDLVYQTEVDALASVDNEYILDCREYASGVYFCMLETESGDRQHCSIAIIK